MKTVGWRSVVLYLLLAAFLCGLGCFVVNLFLHGSQWAMQPYNGHLYAEDADVEMGSIRDRNGNLLAHTEDGRRYYSEDPTVRRALLHTVGDPYSNISTGVEYSMRGRLTGYNVITGLNDTFFSGIGRDITLTVDAEACAAAYRAMNGHNGAAILYNYETGEVLCKVSAPGFDPYDIPEDLEENEAYRGAYLDKSLSGSFTPGSIFKIVTAAAAMERWPDSWDSRSCDCYGSVEIGGDEVTCLHGTAHGTQDIYAALGNSCNVYFALLAEELGAEALQKKAEEMGFGRAFSVAGVPTQPSEIDLSHANENQLAWAGVGQYTLLANPAHMMLLMGAVANGGEYVQPRLAQGDIFSDVTAGGDRRLLPAGEAANLKALLRNNVESYYGDWLFPEGLRVCAKTGTGEVGEWQEPNCWMVGFCDDRQHPYAFAVLVEDGAGGLESAGSVAAAMLAALVS